ncbi:MAG: putative molybdenum carrier protein [Bacteroidales bacterium]|nr:putative molybdenum carrier protein [Bacteroidales bacterium]
MKFPRNNVVIHSGGQTGVDRAALDFALCNDINCTGWCPQNRGAEDGPINFRYPLRQVYSSNPILRTELNVIDCDGTFIIIFDEMDQGTLMTQDFARLYEKPLFVWMIGNKNNDPGKFKRWLVQHNIKHLNIAGPRESFAPGIYQNTLELLERLLMDD